MDHVERKNDEVRVHGEMVCRLAQAGGPRLDVVHACECVTEVLQLCSIALTHAAAGSNAMQTAVQTAA